ncbi:TBC1 domain family member 2B-like [Megalops cyprinoides]|uniref:TBC1 domain family member 2B-like n=1 Tax=Megalops cyprinoides TaxID=118141 RepID=UPI001864F7B0|nr:TBC1 domain family member 2B-like [Megalops cyprinoides]
MHEGDGSGATSVQSPRITAGKCTEVASVEDAKDQATKLCGYLNKLAGKGPLRGFKSRWFVYDPRTCYLYYFKTPQDALPLGHIEIADASFTYDVEGEEGLFEISTSGKEFILKAANAQVMRYWLQQLQQMRWEFCTSRGRGSRDSWISPTLPHPHCGLVARDTVPDALAFQKPSESMEKVRNDFTVETSAEGQVGEHTALPTSTLNRSIKQWGTDLRISMSHLRPGRGSESRRSMFYADEGEGVDHTTKEPAEQTSMQETPKRAPRDSHRNSTGSGFSFDFGRSSSRFKRLSSQDGAGSGRLARGADGSGAECNGNKMSDTELRLQRQQEELGRLREELVSQKEMVRVLQLTLKSTQWERCPADGPKGPRDTAASSMEQEEEEEVQIRALRRHLEKLTEERDSLQQEVAALKVKMGQIQEQLAMLMETIQAKDQVIMQLSQQGGSVSEGDCSGSPNFTAKELQELDRLRDGLQGYKSQNKFLNKEILELSVLRRNAETREKALEAKYAALEAKLCQVESKYLVLLQEVQNPMCSSSPASPTREVISRLLEDALQVESTGQDEHPVFKPNPVSEYDVYGFKTVPEDDEEERLVAKVRALELRSLSLAEQEVSVGVKWENYFAGTMNREMTRCPELKALVRCGVPHEHRSKVWRWCVAFHVKKFRESVAQGYYESLLGLARERQNPASKQIELDLLRTLPNNKHYSCPASEGIHKLRNILLAFSWRNPDIGYCQGLNRLVAVALLYLEEEEAFWCLVAIVEVFMPRDYYTKTLLGSQVDQRVLKDLMNEKLPRLHSHFEMHKVDFSLITFNWFLVVFVDSVVSDILFKIWDAFLYEGPKIIFRFALALFKHKEEEFLKLHDSTTLFKYLRYFTRTILDGRKLMTMAFVDMNPFPLRQIQNRRSFHLERVRLELTELETIRQTFLRERETAAQSRTVFSDDEEDN